MFGPSPPLLLLPLPQDRQSLYILGGQRDRAQLQWVWSTVGVVYSGYGLQWVWSTMGVVYSGYGLQWVWSAVGMVCSGCGLQWVWSGGGLGEHGLYSSDLFSLPSVSDMFVYHVGRDELTVQEDLKPAIGGRGCP